jgi:hypothetical protein
MTEQFAREIGLLRTLARNLSSGPSPAEASAQRNSGNRAGAFAQIMPEGHEAFSQLENAILRRFPAIQRGTTFASFRQQLMNWVFEHLFVATDALGTSEVSALLEHFENWQTTAFHPSRVLVPCAISPWAAPRFSVGPVEFVFIDEVVRSDFYPHATKHDELSRWSFDKALQAIRSNHANWLARVPVDGCEHSRCEEIGALSVDLAIVALQLAVPNLGTRNMSRIDNRRGGADKQTIHETDGQYRFGWHKLEPGLSIGQGTLADILRKGKPLITAIGERVRSFASGDYRLPTLERAWCDAAYWLHEGLAEPVDSIAVAKLETAIEVLVRAESRSGSELRMLRVLEVFFGLKAADPIAPSSHTTTKQFAKSIVGDRSRVLHGTWSTLNTRLTVSRNRLEEFVIGTLRRFVLELEEYIQAGSSKDHTDGFIEWVRNKAAATVPS